jgi:hypothetical protein
MAIRRLSTASIKTGSKSNKIWDQDTAQGAMEVISTQSFSAAVVHGYSNIPQHYRDLMVVINAIPNNDAQLVLDSCTNPSASAITFTGSNTHMYGTGAAASGSRSSNNVGFTPLTNGSVAILKGGTTATIIVHMLNYSNTSYQKTIIAKGATDNNGSGMVWQMSGLIGVSTAAIGGFNFSTQNGSNWLVGTSTLYGIRG